MLNFTTQTWKHFLIYVFLTLMNTECFCELIAVFSLICFSSVSLNYYGRENDCELHDVGDVEGSHLCFLFK